jgi:hypothetical protein
MSNSDQLGAWWATLTPEQQTEARKLRSGSTPPPDWLLASLATALDEPSLTSVWWETDPASSHYSVREELLDFIAAQRGSWSVYAWATGSEESDVTAAMEQLAAGDLGGTLRNGGLGAGPTTVSVLLDDVKATTSEEACEVVTDKIGAALGSGWSVEAKVHKDD